ncbi:MAG: hypothetical protein P8M16_05180 [Acidimicrobiales bacterium]|jgi:hypothetical protein|nr:hypothetical protein [Acidimicrobiales bacterium]
MRISAGGQVMVEQLTENPCEKLIDISLDYADAGKTCTSDWRVEIDSLVAELN